MSITLDTLPPEILHLIVSKLSESFSLSRKSLLESVSLSCKALRQSSLPLLFETLTLHGTRVGLAATHHERFMSEGMHDHLEHVRILEMTSSEFWRESQNKSQQVSLYSKHIEQQILDKVKLTPKLARVMFRLPSNFTLDIVTNLPHPSLHIVTEILCQPRDNRTLYEWVLQRSQISPGWLFSINPTTKLKVFKTACQQLLHCNRVRSMKLCREFLRSLCGDSQQNPLTLDLTEIEELQILEEGECYLDKSYTLSTDDVARQFLPFTSLKRLSVDGGRPVSEVLLVLPKLQRLEDLRLYSAFRNTFHPNFPHNNRDGEENTDIPTGAQLTTEASWMHLPRLRNLWLRYLCKHHSVSQIVPRGLLGLHIEFYNPQDVFGEYELMEIAERCPDLQQLSIDMARPAMARNHDVGVSLAGLGYFHNLHDLRLCPTYWQNEKLMPHPFPTFRWPLDVFLLAKSRCHRLERLVILVSQGEWPIHNHFRPAIEKRPIKFVVSQGLSDTLFTYSFPDHSQIVQYCCSRSDPVLANRQILSVQGWQYFEELGDQWIHPTTRCAFHGHDEQQSLATPEGRQLLDTIESLVHIE